MTAEAAPDVPEARPRIMRLPARERDENSLSEPCGTPCPSAPVGENPNSEAALGRSEA
jgi:hypothetical protein